MIQYKIICVNHLITLTNGPLNLRYQITIAQILKRQCKLVVEISQSNFQWLSESTIIVMLKPDKYFLSIQCCDVQLA